MSENDLARSGDVQVMEHKTCTRCGEAQAHTEYHRDRHAPDGLRRWCKTCVRNHHQENRDENNRRAREHYYADPQTKIAKTTAYHQANREWSQSYHRNWQQENRERRALIERARWQDDPEFREYRRQIRHARRAVEKGAYAEKIGAEQIAEIISKQSNACVICTRPFSEELPYHLDHWKPVALGGWHRVSNLRALCAPCNLRKGSTWPMTETVIAAIAEASIASPWSGRR